MALRSRQLLVIKRLSPARGGGREWEGPRRIPEHPSSFPAPGGTGRLSPASPFTASTADVSPSRCTGPRGVGGGTAFLPATPGYFYLHSHPQLPQAPPACVSPANSGAERSAPYRPLILPNQRFLFRGDRVASEGAGRCLYGLQRIGQRGKGSLGTSVATGAPKNQPRSSRSPSLTY